MMAELFGVRRMREIESIRTLYHGTSSVHEESFMRGIDLARGELKTDFGRGFYTTSVYKQAEKIATDRSLYYNEQPGSKKSYPMVITYNMDVRELLSLKGLILNETDSRWAEFILNNRLGTGFYFTGFHNQGQVYDYVYGAQAGVLMIGLVQKFKDRQLGFETFMHRMQPQHPLRQSQVSFHTKEAVGCFTLKAMTKIYC